MLSADSDIHMSLENERTMIKDGTSSLIFGFIEPVFTQHRISIAFVLGLYLSLFENIIYDHGSKYSVRGTS